jgi:hypothetical protein
MQSLANRHEEVELFQQIATGKHPKRILLIEAASGLGKTNLLGKFVASCPAEVSCVSVDLKSAKELGIPYILSLIRRRLGRQHFPRFDAQVKEFQRQSNVQVTDNVMEGQDLQIQVLLNVDPETRKYRLLSLRNAFFEDISQIDRPIVIIFDTFNEASPELAEWLGGQFLSELVIAPNLRAVVAGQNVPEPTIEWMADCEYCRLGAIEDVDAWWDFVQNQKLPFPKDAVKAITLTFQGQPKMIIETFSAIAKDWGK